MYDIASLFAIVFFVLQEGVLKQHKLILTRKACLENSC